MRVSSDMGMTWEKYVSPSDVPENKVNTFLNNLSEMTLVPKDAEDIGNVDPKKVFGTFLKDYVSPSEVVGSFITQSRVQAAARAFISCGMYDIMYDAYELVFSTDACTGRTTDWWVDRMSDKVITYKRIFIDLRKKPLPPGVKVAVNNNIIKGEA